MSKPSLPGVSVTLLASATSVRDHQRIKLSSVATPYRYYLLWLTTLPPGEESASISELTLFK